MGELTIITAASQNLLFLFQTDNYAKFELFFVLSLIRKDDVKMELMKMRKDEENKKLWILVAST
jgi:hypothetical protein